MSLFPVCELSNFSTSMNRQWVPCERNSSYNVIPIFLKLCTCFLHGLKTCMWFGCYPCITFCHFFHFGNFVIFWPQILWKCCDSGYVVSATPHISSYRSFWNFAHVISMVWKWACGLDVILALCCVPFSYLWTFVIFWPQILWKCRDSGYLVSATPHTIVYRSLWNFAHVFPMVWKCAYGLDIILKLFFVPFSYLWTFVIFWPQILWKCRDSGYLVSATPHTILYRSLWNFAHVFAMVWKWACVWI